MRPEEYTKFTVSDLYRVLEGLSSFIDREDYTENIEYVMEFINTYDRKDLLAVDDFKVFVHYKQDSYREVLLKVLLGKEQEDNNIQYTKEQVYRLIHYYNHLQTLEGLLEETIVKYEGSPCSSDKSRTIMREYGKKIRGQDVTEEWNNQDYWIPDNGSKERWLAYAEGILELLRGNSQLYIDTKEELEGLLHKVNDEKGQRIKEVCTSHEYYEGETTWRYVKSPVYQFKQTLLDEEDLHVEISVSERGTLYRVYKNRHSEYGMKVEKEDVPEWVTELLEKVQ